MEEVPLRILVVDDNRSSAEALARALRKRGDDTEAVFDGATAIERIEANPPDLVLTDLRMEPVGGMEVLRAARSQRPPCEVIVFTAYGAVNTAVEAMHMGARDFLTKPVTLDQLIRRLEQIEFDSAPAAPAAASGGATTTKSGGKSSTLDETFSAIADSSRELLETLERVADVPSNVWLEGEIGSGRGHAAYTLHRLGRPDEPFTTINLSREVPWPETGTVVLPNVDDLPADLQRSLVRRLRSVPPGVRVVATAAPDALQRVREGELNPELYYGLSVIVIRVPPLRDRVEDILPLLTLAFQNFSSRYGRPVPDLDQEHRDRLCAHSWPGNVRELLNVAERSVVLGSDALDLDIVRRPTPGLPRLEPGFSLAQYLESVERRILMDALRRTGGHRTAAGRLLGVERNTLRYKLNKYDLLDR
jgi:DNA-binding NtrC family response regulator